MSPPPDRNEDPAFLDALRSLRERARQLLGSLSAARGTVDRAKIAHLQSEFQRLRTDFQTLHAMSRASRDLSGLYHELLQAERQARKDAETGRRAAEAAARAAEAAARARDEFLAMLGHELRNPLSAIIAAVSTLGRLSAHDQSEARLCTIITRQSQALSRLVEDLLDVARVTAGKIDLARQPVELRELTDGVLTTLKAAGRDQGYDIRLAGEPVWVSGDPTRLAQIVSNLLDNAFKYTPRGGKIHVTVGPELDAAVTRVRDTGQGMSADLLPRVFDLFTQGATSLHRDDGGLGIGLTLVRRLVELHGGSVSAASAGPGLGAEFVVRLPILATPQAPLAPEPEPVQIPAVPRYVLLVEDHGDARDSLRMMLELMGHRVEVAADGASGVRLAAAAPGPDVAFIDIGLPGFDGYEVARRIREAPGRRAIVLVALTGYGRPEDRLRARAAGFDHHVTKPLTMEQLAEILYGLPPPPPGGNGASAP
jgi:two-component system, sensor histidine kinase